MSVSKHIKKLMCHKLFPKVTYVPFNGKLAQVASLDEPNEKQITCKPPLKILVNKNDLMQIQPKVSNMNQTFLFCTLLKNAQNSVLNDCPTKSSVIEPFINYKEIIESPFNVTCIEDFHLPPQKENEITEPVITIIEKQAHKMLRIRKKKMKRHKWKKLQKKLKYVKQRIRRKRRAAKEKIFEDELSKIWLDGHSFNMETHMREKLELLNWQHPVTRARGRLAPQWVIDEELEKKRRQELLEERIKICLEKSN